MNSEVAAESNAQTVWLVDDNLGEADAYQRLFARGGLGNVEVKGLQNVHHKTYAPLVAQIGGRAHSS